MNSKPSNICRSGLGRLPKICGKRPASLRMFISGDLMASFALKSRRIKHFVVLRNDVMQMLKSRSCCQLVVDWVRQAWTRTLRCPQHQTRPTPSSHLPVLVSSIASGFHPHFIVHRAAAAPVLRRLIPSCTRFVVPPVAAPRQQQNTTATS